MDILQGTLDLLILRALEPAPMHGIGIADRIHQVTRGALVVKPGSLFPALRRLEQKGWVEGKWAPSENNRRARYYTLTRAQINRIHFPNDHDGRITRKRMRIIHDDGLVNRTNMQVVNPSMGAARSSLANITTSSASPLVLSSARTLIPHSRRVLWRLTLCSPSGAASAN